MLHKLFTLCIGIICSLILISSPAFAGKSITIGITTKDDAAAQKDYAPFLKLVKEQVKTEVTLKTFPDLVKLGDAGKSGKIQFLILSPTDYLKLNESVGVQAVATKLNKGGTPYCQGTIIAKKDGEINTLTDLKGKPFCFGPDGSFNKYYTALSAFKTQNLSIKDVKAEYGKSCGNIAGHILEDKSVAGVICDYSWDGWEKKLKDDPKTDQPSTKLKIIGKGPKLRDKAIAATKKVDAKTREKFVNALIALKGNCLGSM